MAELSVTDVQTYTGGRLLAADSETARMLNAALAAARGYTRWPVSPVVVGAVLTLDGPCGLVLDLPTRKLNTLTAVTEDGDALVVATDLNWSANGSVRKVSNAYWSCKYRSIVVTMTHGYTEAEAADWRQAILAMVDEMSKLKTGEGTTAGGLKRKKVDDVEYEWSDAALAELASEAVYSVSAVLDRYCLIPVYLS